MANGSNLFSKSAPRQPRYIVAKGGVAGEVADVREDTKKALGGLANITVDEYFDVAAAAEDAFYPPTATVTSEVVLTPGNGLDPITGLNVEENPRLISITVAGATPGDAPAEATVKGRDAQGGALEEVVPLELAGGVANTKQFFGFVESVTFSAASGTGATLSVGILVPLGLRQRAKARAGAYVIHKEIEDAVVVTTGVITGTEVQNGPFGGYLPATPPDGIKDYAIYYEAEPAI